MLRVIAAGRTRRRSQRREPDGVGARSLPPEARTGASTLHRAAMRDDVAVAGCLRAGSRDRACAARSGRRLGAAATAARSRQGDEQRGANRNNRPSPSHSDGYIPQRVGPTNMRVVTVAREARDAMKVPKGALLVAHEDSRFQSSSVSPSILSVHTYRRPSSSGNGPKLTATGTSMNGRDARWAPDFELTVGAQRLAFDHDRIAVLRYELQHPMVAPIRLVPGHVDLERDRAGRDRRAGHRPAAAEDEQLPAALLGRVRQHHRHAHARHLITDRAGLLQRRAAPRQLARPGGATPCTR